MQGYISAELIKKLKPKEKQYDVRDTSLKGFMLRILPSGKMTFTVEYARGKKARLGHAGSMTAKRAREKAAKIIGDYVDQGLEPKQAEAKRKGVPTLKAFLADGYESWLTTHNESGGEDIKRIRRHFSHLMDTPIDQIKARDIDTWRTKKLESNAMQANTITRIVTPLRSAISKAIKWGVIEHHGLAGLEPLKYDDTRVRYLDSKERKILFETLEKREKRIRNARVRANKWRKSRGYDLYPDIKENEYVDYLLPLVIVSLPDFRTFNPS